MRMAFGLVSILVATLIIMLLMKESLPTVVKQAGPKGLAQQTLGTVTPTGIQEQQETMDLAEHERNGQLVGLLVKNITAENPLAATYGLSKGDIVLAVSGIRAKGPGGDVGMLRDMLLEAKMRHHSITVERKGQVIELKHPE